MEIVRRQPLRVSGTARKRDRFHLQNDQCLALEWCEASERAIDDISNSLFSISEPSWVSEEDSKKLKALKRRVHEVYAKYKGAAGKRSGGATASLTRSFSNLMPRRDDDE